MTTESLADVTRSGRLNAETPLIADFKNLVVRDVTDPYVSPLFCIPYTNIPTTSGPKYIITLRDDDGKERTVGFLSQSQIERYFVNAPKVPSRLEDYEVYKPLAPKPDQPLAPSGRLLIDRTPSKKVGRWTVSRLWHWDDELDQTGDFWVVWWKRAGHDMFAETLGYKIKGYAKALEWASARAYLGQQEFGYAQRHQGKFNNFEKIRFYPDIEFDYTE